MKQQFIIIILLIIIIGIYMFSNQISGEQFQSTVPSNTNRLYNNLILSNNSKDMSSIQFPRGIIMIWAGVKSDGTMADIPEGWALCDGTKGTPDLRGKFVTGVNPNKKANPAYSIREFRQVAGSENVSITLNVNNLPPHTHTFYSGRRNKGVCGSSCAGTNTVTNNNLAWTYPTGSTGETVPFNISIMPPFTALAYIMKII